MRRWCPLSTTGKDDEKVEGTADSNEALMSLIHHWPSGPAARWPGVAKGLLMPLFAAAGCLLVGLDLYRMT
jgi:hypothetical protein